LRRSFDALEQTVIAVFRHIYMTRQNQTNKSTAEKDYLLHGLALIGVRAVLGVENVKGSPFNVQLFRRHVGAYPIGFALGI
jgi:hypothetical protein